MNKRKDNGWNANDGLSLLIWVVGIFFIVAVAVIITEKIFFPPQFVISEMG